MTDKPAVLFVCLGNICRSPLAEAAFRKAAAEAGLEVEVDSAGTAAYHIGDPPDPRSIATAARYGVEISHYQGRKIDAPDYTRFTHIFGLDASNLANIQAAAPANSTAKITLLMDCVAGREGEAVPDPYNGDEAGFELTWRDVSQAASALVASLSGT